ncbi:hypothetical protein KME66_22035 [Streptomyces sp. YPW6]|uniref:hypothetical protein n=1 Tax=Streptomyces sp. YPW6 TaxID=2840373 RepID=UPI001C0C33C3|nr:hypothetical protein [Streptomyces sp. YPW6]QWQ43358.1 hypothetical protein KME66_22035 [Streptomyces sp. YPW6]
MRNRSHRLLCGGLVLLLATSCTDDESGEEATLSASQVCDSTLTPPSAKALERLAATERFTELTGTNQQGDANKFSLEMAAKRLYGGAKDRNTCMVYKAGDDSGIPLLKIEFEPTRNHPAPGAEARNTDRDRLVFPLGVYAEINGDSGANLYFTCSTKGPEGTSPYIWARMYSSGGQLSPGSSPEDRLAVLNDVARGLADQLGCADEAALPDRVPEPSNG